MRQATSGGRHDGPTGRRSDQPPRPADARRPGTRSRRRPRGSRRSGGRRRSSQAGPTATRSCPPPAPRFRRSRPRGWHAPPWRWGCGGQQRRLGAGKDVGERALATGCESIQREGQAEHLRQQPGEALEADRLGDVQVDDQRAQPRPERRARREPLRRRGGNTLAAARADAAAAVDARDHRTDRRQVDVVIGVNVRLVGRCERMGAARTGRKCRLDHIAGDWTPLLQAGADAR